MVPVTEQDAVELGIGWLSADSKPVRAVEHGAARDGMSLCGGESG